MDKFYLTTHRPHWLATVDVNLCVARHHLQGRRTMPRARRGWALDSRGFMELWLNGEWTMTPEEYVALTLRCDTEIGLLEWAAPMDWMCEKEVLAITAARDAERTGRPARSLDYQRRLHQVRTVENFQLLERLWYDQTDVESPYMPPVQGDEPEHYVFCTELYAEAGVDLRAYELVGLGSICRRDDVGEIGEIITAVREAVDPTLPLHGFGMKTLALRRFGDQILTADSASWSYNARRNAPMPGCVGHQSCSNCLRWALAWRSRVLDLPSGQYTPFDVRLQQERDARANAPVTSPLPPRDHPADQAA